MIIRPAKEPRREEEKSFFTPTPHSSESTSAIITKHKSNILISYLGTFALKKVQYYIKNRFGGMSFETDWKLYKLVRKFTQSFVHCLNKYLLLCTLKTQQGIREIKILAFMGFTSFLRMKANKQNNIVKHTVLQIVISDVDKMKQRRKKREKGEK